MFFSRRHGLDRAEDLAHETIEALLRRDDYEFERQEDFLKVCLAFARNVGKEARRQRTALSLEETGEPLQRPRSRAKLSPAESAVLLDQVLRAGQTGLKDWPLVSWAATDRGAVDIPGGNSNRLRVRLHRARKKLADLTGWRQR